jgi:hypothetical protein
MSEQYEDRFVTFSAPTLQALVEKLNTDGYNAAKVIYMGQDVTFSIEDIKGTWVAVVDMLVSIVMPYDEYQYLAEQAKDDDMHVEVTLDDKNAVSGGYKKTNSA